MERREFLGWTGVGLLTSFLPIVIAACSSEQTTGGENSPPQTTPEETAAIPNAEGFLAIGTIEKLNQDGYLQNKEFNVIVVRKDNNSLSAPNPTCPHQQCTVEWKSASNNLSCPCHGSEFTTDGNFLRAPAQKSLLSYEVKEEGNSVLVKVS